MSEGAWSIQYNFDHLLIFSFVSEAVLMLRIYAMFGGRSSILVALLLSLAMTLVTACTIAVYIMLTEKNKCALRPSRPALLLTLLLWCIPHEVTIHPCANINMSFCVALNLPSWFYAYWIPFLIFETLMFLLVLAKGYLTFRSRTRKGLLGDQSLLECLIHDSVLYFFV